MKTIAVLTDFSEQSTHAARYAMHLAKKINADIKLTYARLSPAVIKTVLQPVLSGDYWEAEFEEAADLVAMGTNLAADFEQRNFPGTSMPPIKCDMENQGISDVMSSIMGNDEVMFIVVGLPEDTDMETFVLSNNCQKLIDWANVPVLIVPGETAFRNPEKIAFLANFDNDDTAHINALLNITHSFSPDLMVSNLDTEVANRPAREKMLLKNFHDDIDYGKIYYRNNTDSNMLRQWNWLKAHKKCDMLAIIKQSRQSLKNLFNRANKPGAVYHLTIPLLILPEL